MTIVDAFFLVLTLLRTLLLAFTGAVLVVALLGALWAYLLWHADLNGDREEE